MPPPRLSRKDLFAVLVLAVLPMLLLWRVVFLGEAFVPADLLRDIAPWKQPGAAPIPWNPLMWDGVAEFYPWRAFFSSTVHSGFLPLWNPHQFCGTPFVANSQSAIFYPLNLLFVILPVKAAFGWSVILHLFLTGTFLYLVLRQSLRLTPTSALAGSITWQLCTWQVSWLALPTFLCVSTWMPAAMLCIDRLCASGASETQRADRGSPLHDHLSPALALGVTLGMMILAGHLQICLYGFLLILAYGIFRLVPALFADTAGRSRLILSAGLAVVIAALLGLAQLLPTVELSHMSHRAADTATWAAYKAYAEGGGIKPLHLTTLAAANFLGNPTDGSGPYDYPECACYVGILGLLLAVAGVIATWRTNAETRFFAIAAILALLAAYGTPVNAILYFGIPGFTATGSPGRIAVLWSLCAAILTGIGFEALMNPALRRRRALALALGILAIVVAYGLAAFQAFYAGHGRPDTLAADLAGGVWRLPLAILLLAGCTIYKAQQAQRPPSQNSERIVAQHAPPQRWPRGWWWKAVVGVIAFDLLANGISYNRSTAPANVFPDTAVTQYLQQHSGLNRVMPVNFRWSISDKPPPAILPPNTATVYGLYDVSGYDSLFPGQYMAFMTRVDDNRSPAPDENGNMVFAHGLTSDAARALAPAYIVTVGSVTPGIGAPQLSQVMEDGESVVYKNEEAAPRFDLHGSGSQGADVAATAPAPTRLRLTASQSQSQHGASSRAAATGEDITSSGKESLIIRDQWYPGWKADVDGLTVPVKHGPFVFRTLDWTPRTSAPTATVNLRFEPSSIYAGLYFLCAGWGLASCLLAATWSRRRSLY